MTVLHEQARILYPPITSITLQNQAAHLNVETQSGTRYQLQYKEELGDVIRIDSGSPITVSSSATVFSSDIDNDSKRFFRVWWMNESGWLSEALGDRHPAAHAKGLAGDL